MVTPMCSNKKKRKTPSLRILNVAFVFFVVVEAIGGGGKLVGSSEIYAFSIALRFLVVVWNGVQVKSIQLTHPSLLFSIVLNNTTPPSLFTSSPPPPTSHHAEAIKNQLKKKLKTFN